jgi:hypothetical protein
MKIDVRRKRQFIGILTGSGLGLLALIWLFLPANETDTMLGPMNTGHENLSCNECHIKAEGNLGQQVQTNISYLMGNRRAPVTFGLETVDNSKCQACHDRPNDRHPVHRFEEARFAEARKNIRPTQCASCHLEHSGARVTIPNPGYCVNCHQDTHMKNDPLDVPHSELVAQNRWNTCLQCHDFHGNHIYEVPKLMKDTFSMEIIKSYLKGGDSPYTANKKYRPKQSIYK